MAERPILFTGPMVRAILAGRKTQTRRIVKLRPTDGKCASDCSGVEVDKAWPDPGLGSGGYLKVPCKDEAAQRVRYQSSIGDRLWVKETFVPDYFDQRPKTAYRADYDKAKIGDVVPEPKWTPSIFMPRKLSRILLEIVGVRVERLHSISEEDAKAEGVEVLQVPGIVNGEPGTISTFGPNAHRNMFALLWERINGKRAPWKSNPWVWVVSFRRIVT